MNESILSKYVNFRVKVFCNNHIIFHGVVKNVDTEGFLLHDKYGHDVYIRFDSLQNVILLGEVSE